jgi:hypothetical protein
VWNSAPLLNWIFRLAVTLAALGAVVAVLPVPATARAVALAGGLVTGLAVAFRYRHTVARAVA